jgi:D-alanyl-D-alanine carboxypeptidase
MTLMLRFGAVALLVAASHSAQAGPSIVVDATSGRIIHAEDATAPWFPASITKLMTAYVALREVKAGRINFETPLVVSKRAASAAPSKIGFKPGSEVTLENALKIIMVKSANDVSITIAEGVGGSVDAFSAMMNREAARLGMRESNFVNPNGLPDARNSTSARDMAVLARAMLTEMPEYEELWGIGAIRLGKRVMQNTNGLIGRYPGADGMKTGFICSSGFNVVASASRNGRRIIVVVLGSPTAAERTIKAADLFDKGFSHSGWGGGQALFDLPSGAGSPPDMRPEICGKNRIPIEDESDSFGPVTAASTVHDSNPSLAIFANPEPASSSVRISSGARRTLGPRAKFDPIQIYAGRAPGTKLAARGPGAPVTAAIRPSETANTAIPVASGPQVTLPAAGAIRRPSQGQLPANANAYAQPSQAAGAIRPSGKPAPLNTTGAPILLQGSVLGSTTPALRPSAAASIVGGAKPARRDNAGRITPPARPVGLAATGSSAQAESQAKPKEAAKPKSVAKPKPVAKSKPAPKPAASDDDD